VTVVDATDSDFRLLVERSRAGDAEAMARLYDTYGGLVSAAVRRRLPERLRKEYDTVDFAQDVWASFCNLPPDQTRFDSPDALGNFLAAVARNKVVEVCRRRYGTAAYDVTRQRAMYRTADGTELPLPGREATPSQCAIAGERLAAIADRLPAAHRPVLDLLRAGHTQQEIAERIGVSDRHVRRIVDRVRELCEDAP